MLQQVPSLPVRRTRSAQRRAAAEGKGRPQQQVLVTAKQSLLHGALRVVTFADQNQHRRCSFVLGL